MGFDIGVHLGFNLGPQGCAICPVEMGAAPHSDRGSQYSSEQFQRLMAELGVTCSMSRSGNVWDNAAMESFFSSLKTERIRGRIYRSRDQARADVFDYIECFYNPRRRHSTIGHLSPRDFEALDEAG